MNNELHFPQFPKTAHSTSTVIFNSVGCDLSSDQWYSTSAEPFVLKTMNFLADLNVQTSVSLQSIFVPYSFYGLNGILPKFIR